MNRGNERGWLGRDKLRDVEFWGPKEDEEQREVWSKMPSVMIERQYNLWVGIV